MQRVEHYSAATIVFACFGARLGVVEIVVLALVVVLVLVLVLVVVVLCRPRSAELGPIFRA